MNTFTMEPHQSDVWARSIGLTFGVGIIAGATAGMVVAVWGMGGDSLAAVIALGAMGAIYGSVIGGVAGWAVGLPTVAVAAFARRWTSHWRGMSSALAAAPFLVVWGFGEAPLDEAVLGVLVALLAAGGSWWGLGRVFRPTPAVAASEDASTLSR